MDKPKPKQCPLLSASDQDSCSYCEGDRCAVTYLASIAYGVRAT